MAENKIVGYKNIFGLVLPDWVDESLMRVIVMFLLSIVAMFFVLIFVIWPKFETIKEQNNILKTKQTQLESLKVSKAGFDKLNDQIPEESQLLVLKAIPQVYAPESAVFLLRNISNEIPGLSIVSYSLPSGTLYEASGSEVKPNSDKSTDMVSFMSYPVKISLSAPIGSLLSFIDKVEKSLPFGVVSDLGVQEISKLSKSNVDDKTVNMDLELRYYQAVLKKVDISGIKTFTDQDLKLVKDIAGFNQISGTESMNIPPVVNSTGSLFGF